MGDSFGGSMRPVRAAKGIVDINGSLAQPASLKTPDHWLPLPDGNADFRAEAHLPGWRSLTAFSTSGPMQSETNVTFLPNKLRQPRGHGSQRELRLGLALGTAQMRSQHENRAMLHADTGWSGALPGCAGHP